jgi:hypothetical protein
MTRSLGWYARRLRGMSAAEVVARAADQARRTAWARRQVRPGEARNVATPAAGLREFRSFPTTLDPETRDLVLPHLAAEVIDAADRLLAGEWSVFGTARPDIADPDWFLDPVTGRRAPQDLFSFRIDHRDEDVTGNVKSVWELSRHHHLTVLACAYWLTGEETYAETVARQLRGWWAANPLLSGVHWTSGIEIGVRLISWAWIRRLLDDWPKVGDLFETDPEALRHIRWHQEYLAVFPSRGSSANNHAIAEDCGLIVAACAFPWYVESDGWRDKASRRLHQHLADNTFPSGVNREMATDYHRFVTELGLVTALEADAAGHPLHPDDLQLLARSSDVAAALVDSTGRPPRQGDGDEGRALLLDHPDADSWEQLLDLGEAMIGRLPWWPRHSCSVLGAMARSLAGTPEPAVGRPERRPEVFEDAGLALLRTPAGEQPEIWVRCDGGPHGFGSIAAHGHADALSVEVRHDGVDVLVDPGTYCYHGEPQWRSWFRSTLAHNTLEIDGENQSVEGGPFLWSTRAKTEVATVETGDGDVQTWSAHHTGYARLDPDLRHLRALTLDRRSGRIVIRDTVTTRRDHTVRLAFHFGTDVEVTLDGALARLAWSSGGRGVTAILTLPDRLRWTRHRGETDPPLGWHSPRFGERVPTTALIGTGVLGRTTELVTCLGFGRGGNRGGAADE